MQARAHLAHHGDAVRVESVAFRNVASFVFEPSLLVPVGGRKIPVDIAFGGAFYAIVDAEAAGVPIDARASARAAQARHDDRARGRDGCAASCIRTTPGLEGIYGTIFTAPAHLPDAHLRNVTIFADAEVDRSPCGTGTAAVMAVLNDMGLLLDDVPFVHESIVGTTFNGRVVDRVAGGRATGDRPRDRRVRLDHRRAHLPDRRGRSVEGRISAVDRYSSSAAIFAEIDLPTRSRAACLMSARSWPSIVTMKRLPTRTLSSPRLSLRVPLLDAGLAAEASSPSRSRRSVSRL